LFLKKTPLNAILQYKYKKNVIIKEYKIRFKDVDITKPSICNGLDKININRLEEIITPVIKSKVEIKFEK
jgi:hypothetical protein